MTFRLRPFPNRISIFISVLIAFLSASSAFAQQSNVEPYQITYQMSMPHPESHLFEVRIEVHTTRPEPYVDFQMPRWSPGRYAIFDFAKNVQEFSAGTACPPQTKCEVRSLKSTRIDIHTWRIDTRGNQHIAASYKVFANDLSGTFSQLDERHANFNGASVFMYVVGHKQDPVNLRIDPPAGWRIINGYTERADQREWQFPNYDLLIDTPTEIGPDWTVDEFKVDGKSYRVVVHSLGNEGGKRPALVRDIERIVRAQTAMWGTPDFASYTFMIHYAPGLESGDGMEHLNSTQIIETRALAEKGQYEETLGTASHEFFHVWNVKRLRPVELGPWDFTRPLATPSLWIAEGLTNYYGSLMLRRAGIWDEKQLLNAFEATINHVENLPGNRLISAEEASIIAPFIDRARHVQKTNLMNTTISYYTKGEALGLVLDLLIRGKTDGRASLDDVMRRMYDEFYLRSPNATYYLKGRGYTSEDFERVTSEVAGTDLSYFFRHHVRDTQTPPYMEALAYVGLRLVREKAQTSSANNNSSNRTTYRIEEIKDAPSKALALRSAWLKKSTEY